MCMELSALQFLCLRQNNILPSIVFPPLTPCYITQAVWGTNLVIIDTLIGDTR